MTEPASEARLTIMLRDGKEREYVFKGDLILEDKQSSAVVMDEYGKPVTALRKQDIAYSVERNQGKTEAAISNGCYYKDCQGETLFCRHPKPGKKEGIISLGRKGLFRRASDYGKTWALTKEELE